MSFKCRVDYTKIRSKPNFSSAPYYNNTKQIRKFMCKEFGCDYSYNYYDRYFVLVFRTEEYYTQFKLCHIDIMEDIQEHI